MPREIRFDDMEGGGASETAAHYSDKRMQGIYVDGRFAGFIIDDFRPPRFCLQLGEYPNEKVIGFYNTLPAAQKAARRELSKGDESGSNSRQAS